MVSGLVFVTILVFALILGLCLLNVEHGRQRKRINVLERFYVTLSDDVRDNVKEKTDSVFDEISVLRKQLACRHEKFKVVEDWVGKWGYRVEYEKKCLICGLTIPYKSIYDALKDKEALLLADISSVKHRINVVAGEGGENNETA